MRDNTKNVFKLIICGLVIVLLVVISCVSCTRQAKAETIQQASTMELQPKAVIYSPSLGGFSDGSYAITDINGYPVKFGFLKRNESQYDNVQFFVRFQLSFYDGYFMTGEIQLYKNDTFSGSPWTTIYYYEMQNNTISPSLEYFLGDSFFGGLGIYPYEKDGALRGQTIDTNSYGWQRVQAFFNVVTRDQVQDLSTYNRGYNDGYAIGKQDGQVDVVERPHDFGLYDSNDISNTYTQGLETGEEGVAKSTNWFTAIFTGISNVFSIRIFGGTLTLGMLCMVPFAIEFVFVIFKIIRGGE